MTAMSFLPLPRNRRPINRRSESSGFRPAPGIGLLLAALLCLPSVARGQSSEVCLVCHSDPNLETERNGRKISLFVSEASLRSSVHAGFECTDCHQGLNPEEIPHAKTIEPVQCRNCHDVGDYDKSVHGMALGTRGCSDCHGTHDILAPDNPDSLVNRSHLASSCGRCHRTEDDRYSRSAHGVALADGQAGAPSCIECHSNVHTMPPIETKESPLFKSNEAKVCLRCHIDNPDVRKQVGLSAGFIAGYEESIHGVAILHGDLNAATCSNCHGAHDVLSGSDPDARTGKLNVPRTCGQCHPDIAKTYYESIHGTALKEGVIQAPNCTDCHGEHQIFAPEDPRSRVAGRNVSARVCAVCHNSLPLTQKYGLESERFQTFEDSYHGLASRAGAVQVANCASCHGYHNIKPSSDPTSTINPANLATTCGKCHAGANENFAIGKVHLDITPVTQPILYWIRSFYIGLIIVTIGGMFVHNAFDFVAKSKERLAMRRGEITHKHYGPNLYLRMTLNERIQHGVLTVTFIVLVITGFMLKFPDAWWVTPIRRWSERVFEVRGITHRIAGALLIAASIYHVYYLSFVSRGRQLVRDLAPRLSDVRDLWGAVKYYLRLSKTRPKFGRFAYIEKAEYWALIWGTAIMSATGIIMWFDNFFISRLTLLGWNVALTIHYWEAWLATLAILVWHFYFTIFNPNVYPMNTSWISGWLTEEEMAEEHPLELERIRSEEIRNDMDEDAPGEE